MNTETLELVSDIFGPNVTDIIDDYIDCPSVDSLIRKPTVGEWVSVDDYMDTIIEMNASEGLNLECEYSDGDVVYHGRECEYYTFLICTIDRYIITVYFGGYGDDIQATTAYKDDEFSWRIYKKEEFGVKHILIDSALQNIPFMLQFFGGDFDKFTKFVKVQHNKYIKN